MDPLAEHLASFDYIALSLVRAATGHLRLQHAAIDGGAITLYLDTGAGRTVIDVNRARDLGLALEDDPRVAGGAGAAAMRSWRTRLASFEIGGVTEADFPASAIDLSHVNQALRARGEEPMDGVLGADVLDAREAVIDYKHLRLFLKRTVRTRAAAA